MLSQIIDQVIDKRNAMKRERELEGSLGRIELDQWLAGSPIRVELEVTQRTEGQVLNARTFVRRDRASRLGFARPIPVFVILKYGAEKAPWR